MEISDKILKKVKKIYMKFKNVYTWENFKKRKLRRNFGNLLKFFRKFYGINFREILMLVIRKIS